MTRTKRQLLVCTIAYALSLAHLAGCGTPTHKDVGAVVVAPKKVLPAPPVIVQETLPKPVGYFHQTSLDYFSPKTTKPTPSTLPTSAAGQTPSQ